MQSRRVGATGLTVSRLGLGTMTWGRDTDEHEAREQLRLFVEAGGTLVDTAAGYAAMTVVPSSASVLTVEYKLNLVAPADGEKLIARGQVVRPGRTLIVTRAEVFAIKAGRETLCALMQQTIMVMHGKTEK